MSEEQVESLNREIAEMADICGQWEANYKSAENRAMRAGAKLREVEKQRDRLLKTLKNATRYIEVRTAYKGAMTAAEVEAAITNEFFPSVVEIGANSCNTLASFDFDAARALIAEIEGSRT